MLACLVGTIVYVSAADTFYIRDPEIVGNQHIGREEIREAANVVGINIFWIHPRQVEERIRAIRGVKNVRVHCVLPAKVTIEVEERKPVILWRVEAQSKDFWLDEEGLVLTYGGVPTETVFVVDRSQRQKEIVVSGRARRRPPALRGAWCQGSGTIGRSRPSLGNRRPGEWPVIGRFVIQCKMKAANIDEYRQAQDSATLCRRPLADTRSTAREPEPCGYALGLLVNPARPFWLLRRAPRYTAMAILAARLVMGSSAN
jgi:hypothetical protein